MAMNVLFDLFFHFPLFSRKVPITSIKWFSGV